MENSINIEHEDIRILSQINPGAYIQLENIALKREREKLMNQIQVLGPKEQSKNGVVSDKEKVK